MKVYILEFTIFNGVHWKKVDYKITAQTLEELKIATMNELRWMSEKITPEEKWNLIQKDIIETTLTFPIIQINVWND